MTRTALAVTCGLLMVFSVVLVAPGANETASPAVGQGDNDGSLYTAAGDLLNRIQDDLEQSRKSAVFASSGGEWTNMNPSSSPLHRYSSAMAYDSHSGRMVLFGGYSPEVVNDTWVYDVRSNVWTNMSPDSSPFPRFGHAMAYDSQSDRVIMFGGGCPYADTWAYDLDTNTWTEMNPAAHPSARSSYGMAYDSCSDRIILFGGQYNQVYLSDTWAYDFDDNTWTEMSPTTHPSARNAPAMTYDAESDRTILFGGYTGVYVSDTWAYDFHSNMWTNMNPGTGPSNRFHLPMAYDAHSDLVVLFSGYEGSTYFDDTWTYDFDSNTWTYMNPSVTPSSRGGHAMAYDSWSCRIVLFGGGLPGYPYTSNETWTYQCPSSYAVHASIAISGDAGFTPSNGVIWGSGTHSDPYIIEGWEFDSSSGQGISLQSTSAYVVIRGNSIHDTYGSGGIELWYCTNVEVVNNLIFNNSQSGIFLMGGQDNSIKNNDISWNPEGIGVFGGSRNITMEENNLVHDSIVLGWSWSVSELSSHTIATNNLVNGNPVYYYRDGTGLVVDGGIVGELIIVNFSDVQVSNLECSNLLLTHVTDGHISGNTVANCDRGISVEYSSNITVEQNYILSAGREGVYLFDNNGTAVLDNVISENRFSGIYLEGTGATISGNNITGNGGDGICLDWSSSVSISGNELVDNRNSGVDVWHSSGIDITDNSASLNGAGVFLGYASHLTVAGNNLSSNAMGGIIVEEQISDVTIANNDISSNAEYGIHSVCLPSEITANITIAENTVNWNDQAGVYLEFTDNTSVSENHITHNGDGITLISCEVSEIEGNDIASNGNYGIYLNDTGKTSLTGNNCSGNLCGVFLDLSSDNTLRNNTFISNDEYGVCVARGSNNRIWNNTFCCNNGAGDTYDPAHVQAGDSGTGNSWNDEDGHGNNWSEWTGPDSNMDGIVDYPYVLDGSGGATDLYPMTTLVTPIPEFGSMPIVVMVFLAVVVLAISARRIKA